MRGGAGMRPAGRPDPAKRTANKESIRHTRPRIHRGRELLRAARRGRELLGERSVRIWIRGCWGGVGWGHVYWRIVMGSSSGAYNERTRDGVKGSCCRLISPR